MDDPACLDFHHVDAADKVMAVTKMVPFGYSKEDIRDEIDKCALLCANCHRQEHHDLPDTTGSEREPRPNSDRKCDPKTREGIRRWSLNYRQAYGCRKCGMTDPRCLQFHHTEPAEKEMGVGSMISHGYSREDILAEVDLCEVLCGNCHRKEHYRVPRSSENDRV